MISPTSPTPPFPGPPAGPGAPAPQQWGFGPGRQMGMPVGAVIAFAGEVLQQSKSWAEGTTDLQHFNWKVCDGSQLLIAEYPELFAVLGYRYGKGDAPTQKFSLPNYQGQFLRAVDPDAKIDPDKKNRKAAPGANDDDTGVGSTQKFALQDHKHSLTQTESSVTMGALSAEPYYEPSGESDTGYVDQDQETSTGKTVQVSENETRPTNISVYWLIKCKPDVVS